MTINELRFQNSGCKISTFRVKKKVLFNFFYEVYNAVFSSAKVVISC